MMNRIIIGVSWSCPHCDEINNDKHYSDDGPVDELFCGGCGEWIYLKEEKNDE